MTTPEALNALADRVEREGPSRELDAAILVVMLGDGWTVSTANGWVCVPHQEIAEAPTYTTSLDSAVTLVPEGWHVDVHDWRWSEEPCWAVAVQRVTGTYTSISVKAKTEAMARVSASLRARAADMQARAGATPDPATRSP